MDVLLNLLKALSVHTGVLVYWIVRAKWLEAHLVGFSVTGVHQLATGGTPKQSPLKRRMLLDSIVESHPTGISQ